MGKESIGRCLSVGLDIFDKSSKAFRAGVSSAMQSKGMNGLSPKHFSLMPCLLKVWKFEDV